jgi:hypothetical protein
MPSPGDPSYDRQQRAARARRAASDASGERLAELREKYLAPVKPGARAPAPGARATASAPATPTPRVPSVPKPHPIDTAGIARTARAALDKHPGTWTSYAELCSAMGMTRSSAGVLARQHIFEPTGSHWFRIRSDDGVYEAPTVEEGADEAGPLSPADADAQLIAIGVGVVDGRADPDRKLGWNGSAWTRPGSA